MEKEDKLRKLLEENIKDKKIRNEIEFLIFEIRQSDILHSSIQTKHNGIE